MGITEKITAWLSRLEDEERGLFPYLLNTRSDKFDSEKDTVYYGGPYWDHAEIVAAIRSLLASRWLSAGPAVSAFEASFSKSIGATHSVMVNSGSSANLVAIAAMKSRYGWDDGDEVIVAAVSFPTTVAPIIQNNLKPVLVDIDWRDLNIDISRIERILTPKTRAIVLSPALGNPPDLDRLLPMLEHAGIRVVLDGCDSLGSTWNGHPLSAFADVSTCSFYPAHHITTGEGGMVSVREEKIAKIARSIVNWGRDCYCEGAGNLLPNGTCGKRFDHWMPKVSHPVDHKYLYTQIGYNLKPLDLQGAIGLVQLKKLPEIVQRRRELKNMISIAIEQSVPGARVVNELSPAKSSWFAVPVVCEDPVLCAELIQHLEAHRIQTRTFFGGSLLNHPAYQHLGQTEDFPIANRVSSQVFFIGCSPTFKPAMVTRILEVIHRFSRRTNAQKAS